MASAPQPAEDGLTTTESELLHGHPLIESYLDWFEEPRPPSCVITAYGSQPRGAPERSIKYAATGWGPIHVPCAVELAIGGNAMSTPCRGETPRPTPLVKEDTVERKAEDDEKKPMALPVVAPVLDATDETASLAVFTPFRRAETTKGSLRSLRSLTTTESSVLPEDNDLTLLSGHSIAPTTREPSPVVHDEDVIPQQQQQQQQVVPRVGSPAFQGTLPLLRPFSKTPVAPPTRITPRPPQEVCFLSDGLDAPFSIVSARHLHVEDSEDEDDDNEPPQEERRRPQLTPRRPERKQSPRLRQYTLELPKDAEDFGDLAVAGRTASSSAPLTRRRRPSPPKEKKKEAPEDEETREPTMSTVTLALSVPKMPKKTLAALPGNWTFHALTQRRVSRLHEVPAKARLPSQVFASPFDMRPSQRRRPVARRGQPEPPRILPPATPPPRPRPVRPNRTGKRIWVRWQPATDDLTTEPPEQHTHRTIVHLPTSPSLVDSGDESFPSPTNQLRSVDHHYRGVGSSTRELHCYIARPEFDDFFLENSEDHLNLDFDDLSASIVRLHN